MPSKRTTQTRPHLRWDPPYWEHPTTGPSGVDASYQSWTNDLLISGGNHGHAIRKGYMGAGHPDRGGAFLVHKRSYEENILGTDGLVHFSWSPDPAVTASPYHLTNQWPWRDTFNNSHFPLPTASTDEELQALGATAIARCKPGKSEADFSTFVGELREGLPSAVGFSRTGRSRTLAAKNAGDEYLNVEFGWKPLLRDLDSFLDTYRNSAKLYKKFQDGAGKLIKRKYRFPTELKIEEESLGYRMPQPLLHPWLYSSGQAELILTRSEKIERWFSGAFIYAAPESDYGLWNQLGKADALYGSRPDPETLWNIAPWSWAADWVSNAGDVVSNLASFMQDGLVMHHGYMMEHRTNVYTYSMRVHDMWHSHQGKRTLSQTFTGETKKRIVATPYGFGLNWDDFSSQQLGILGALGISRTK